MYPSAEKNASVENPWVSPLDPVTSTITPENDADTNEIPVDIAVAPAGVVKSAIEELDAVMPVGATRGLAPANGQNILPVEVDTDCPVPK